MCVYLSWGTEISATSVRSRKIEGKGDLGQETRAQRLDGPRRPPPSPSGLDLDRFRIDLKDPKVKEAVYADHLDAVDLWRAEAVPTVIVGEERIEGAAPPPVYQAALARLL